MITISIENKIADVFANYGNTTYLQKTNAKSLDEIRGTELWKLWYGEKINDFCVRTLKDEYRKARQNNNLMPDFEANLNKLLISLEEEFNNLSNLERRKTL